MRLLATSSGDLEDIGVHTSAQNVLWRNSLGISSWPRSARLSSTSVSREPASSFPYALPAAAILSRIGVISGPAILKASLTTIICVGGRGKPRERRRGAGGLLYQVLTDECEGPLIDTSPCLALSPSAWRGYWPGIRLSCNRILQPGGYRGICGLRGAGSSASMLQDSVVDRLCLTGTERVPLRYASMTRPTNDRRKSQAVIVAVEVQARLI